MLKGSLQLQRNGPRGPSTGCTGMGDRRTHRQGRLLQRKNKEKIQDVSKELVKAIEKVQKRTFQPERENDELTFALRNVEHT